MAQNYGVVFSAWRKQAGKTWHAYVEHEFVEGLRRGDLPHGAFLHYLTQDYLFLLQFARAWSLAAAKAQSMEEMQLAISTVHGLLQEEIQLHIKTCAREGLSEKALQTAQEEPENLAYTRYVLATGYQGDFLDLLAALTPCVLGYGEIGARLKAEAAPKTPYQEWIDTYSGIEFQTMCHNVGQLLDTAILHRLGASYAATGRMKQLATHSVTATRLEVDFWAMGLRAKPKQAG